MDEARKLRSFLCWHRTYSYLGLIREGEGVAARVLNNLGVSLK